jgi:uncharacterized protein
MYILKSGYDNILFLVYGYHYLKTKEFNFHDKKLISSAKKTLGKIISDYGMDATCFKPSRYNIYKHTHNDEWLVYNTLYNTMARLDDKEYVKMLGKDLKVTKTLLTNLVKNGLWIPKKLNEKSVYLSMAEAYNKQNMATSHIGFNLTTTLRCNAKCPYCYEKGVRKINFPKNKVAALLDFMESRVASRKDRQVVLNWFGGEPLINQPFISALIEGLKSRNIEYSSYIITNGSLINESLVKNEFKAWNVKNVQITIDGLKQTYERIKRFAPSQKFTFESILDVIKLFSGSEIDVHIRLNVCRGNRQEILQLAELLQSKFSADKNITYYPAFLTGIGDDLSPEEKQSFVKELLCSIKNPHKINMLGRLTLVPVTRPCMVNDPNSYTVDVNGDVYPCEHRVGRKEYSIGSLDHFDEQENKKRSKLNIPNYCKKCVFLPKCCGGCCANDETKDERCMIIKYLISAYLDTVALM